MVVPGSRVGLWLLTGLLVLGLSSCTLVKINLAPEQEPLKERVIQGQGPDKVALLHLSGILLEDRLRRGLLPWSGREGVLSRLAEELAKAAADEEVKAVLVMINSPGGSVAASDLVFHQLETHRQKTGQKVVACLMGVAASGGYYSALAADRITALPTSTTGSIGAVALRLDISGLMEKYGLEAEAVRSGPHKDMWSLFRPSTGEERAIMQSLIDEFSGRFKSLVKERRPGMDKGSLEKAFDGRIFTAGQALELGLIDELAYPDQAFERAKELAGLKEARLVLYHRPGAYRPNFYAASKAWPGAGPALTGLTRGPHFMYLWQPGLN
jgi:protease-4